MDNTPSKLQKRCWSPFVCVTTNKWYTGYDGSIDYAPRGHPAQFKIAEDQLHETRVLELTPVSTERGRSSATMIFKDRAGFRYSMSLTGGFALIKSFIHKQIASEGIYLKGTFQQVKKGSSIFIESC
jgi:hypothetical protein